MIVLETDRLILRRLTADDADFMFSLMNDPSYIRNIGDRGLRTPALARQYIVDVVASHYEQFGYGMYLTVLKDDGVPVGIAGLVNRDTLEDVDVGFAVAPPYWGEGYATESAAAVLEHARRDFGICRIVGIVSPGNSASIRVLEKLGLVFEGMVQLTPSDDPIRLYGGDLG